MSSSIYVRRHFNAKKLLFASENNSYNPRMETIEIQVDGRLRRAVAILPQGSGSWPVVMLLHGAGGTPEWAIRETRWDSLAVQKGFALVAPEATRPHPKLPIRFYTNPPVWNDGSNRPPADQVSQVDDVAFLRVLLEEMPRRFSIDPRRIYITGFSNGAGMTFRAGLELSDRIAAIGPVAGHLAVSEPKPSRRLPTIYLIGTADPLIPLAGGTMKTPWAENNIKPPVNDTLRRWANLLGLPPEPETATSEREGIRREIWPGGDMEAWFIDGLGHHWPGGMAGLNPRIAGAPSDLLDATRTIWQFFRSRSL